MTTLGVLSLILIGFVIIYNNLLEIIKLIATYTVLRYVVGLILLIYFMSDIILEYLDYIK